MADNILVALLKQHGPGLTSDFIPRLEATGLSYEAARQRIHRGGPGVMKLAGLSFPKNARFLYLEAQFASQAYWDALIRDIGKASPAYSAAVAALAARGGLVPVDQFPIICGAPILQKGQVPAATVLARLTAVQVLRIEDVPGVGDCVALRVGRDPDDLDHHRLKARLSTEKILLLAVKDWARRLGMASWDKVATRLDGEPPRYGPYAWDLTGPSYVRPLTQWTKEGKLKPGFVVCDVLFGERVEAPAMAAFVRKVQAMASLPKVPVCMAMIVADGFTSEAVRLGRSHGVLVATPGSLLGRDVALGLSALMQMLTKAAAAAVKRPELIPELFDRLGQIEGAVGQMRGSLFELLVGHAVHETEAGSIDIGRRMYGPEGVSSEFDVLLVKERRSVRTYECKAHHPGALIDLDAAKAWLEKDVPKRFAILRSQERFRDSALAFELWTTGGFTPEALAFLTEAKARLQRYEIAWKDGDAVRAYVRTLKTPGLMKMLDDYYFRHPLSLVDRKFDGPEALRELSVDLQLGPADDVDQHLQAAEAIAPAPPIAFDWPSPPPASASALSNGSGGAALAVGPLLAIGAAPASSEASTEFDHLAGEG
jgi:hypothetical protein